MIGLRIDRWMYPTRELNIGVRLVKPCCCMAAPSKPSVGGQRSLVLVVGVALIDSTNYPSKVLIAQRPRGKANEGLWEFPGGKIEPWESPEAALVRELREELGIKVLEADLMPLSFASYAYPTFHLLMPLFACTRWEGSVRGAEGQEITWASAGELNDSVLDDSLLSQACSIRLTPADIPLVQDVIRALRRHQDGHQAPPDGN